MRPRTEALAGVGVLALIIGVAAALGQRQNQGGNGDDRASTLLAGPQGVRGLADGLTRLGIRVIRLRGARSFLPTSTGATDRTVLALLDPSSPLSGSEQQSVLAWSDSASGGDLLLAGPGASAMMRCFGFAVQPRIFDSVSVRAGSAMARGMDWPKVGAVLSGTTDSVVVDSSRTADYELLTCTVPPIGRVDTLLVSTSGRALALRLERADLDRRIILLADVGLLRNRTLRDTDAGPFALGLFQGHYDRALFEESHHGFGVGGSLQGAAFRWSLDSPWGWAMWQVALVGLLALLGGAFRFGAPRYVLVRRRRSPLEHVRALATALAAARGHDVAIASIVEGLRRRLLPAGQRARGDWRAWLTQLADYVRTPRARDAVRTLQSLTRPGQSPQGVLRAANAVEDVWEELRP